MIWRDVQEQRPFSATTYTGTVVASLSLYSKHTYVTFMKEVSDRLVKDLDHSNSWSYNKQLSSMLSSKRTLVGSRKASDRGLQSHESGHNVENSLEFWRLGPDSIGRQSKSKEIYFILEKLALALELDMEAFLPTYHENLSACAAHHRAGSCHTLVDESSK